MKQITPWISDTPVRSPFALPTGPVGRAAGRFMLWANRRGYRDIRDLLEVQPDERVLEVGYGPGGLIRELCQGPAARICGVDPSADMRRQAAALNRAGAEAGRVDLRVGAAEETGFADAEFDCVVSVNTVAMWSDLQAGMRELRRVARPGGRVVLAWHGGTSPSRIGRRLALAPELLQRIAAAMGDRFASVQRRELPALTVFDARR